MYAAWIGFAGAVIGGLFTLAGVLITIRYYRIQEKRNDTRRDRNGSSVFLHLINLQVKTIRKVLRQNEKGEYTGIKSSPVILDEEKILLFKQMPYLSSYLKDKQIDELIDFICLLSELESERKDYIKVLGDDKKETVEEGIYLTILGDLRSMLDGSVGKYGVENILKDLEDKIR